MGIEKIKCYNCNRIFYYYHDRECDNCYYPGDYDRSDEFWSKSKINKEKYKIRRDRIKIKEMRQTIQE